MAKKKKLFPWQKADKECPVSPELLKEVADLHNYPMKTKEDFRFFVLFNMVRSIDEKVNRSKEASFLRRIQENIADAANEFL